MLKIENLTKSYGVKKLFNDFSIQGFDKADVIGIIGENGRGKSTLLKMIYGFIKPDFGTIKFDIKEPQIGYMSQDIRNLNENEENFISADYTILNYIKKYSGYNEIEKKITKIYENYDKDKIEELGILEEQLEKLGGYEFEHKIKSILSVLFGYDVWINEPMNHLSGGQKSKVLLALALLKGGDILLLDEPTNNLDTKSVEWLIDYIQNLESLVFVVSHDKYFLNQITNKILELGRSEIKLYSGNYDFYELQKELEQNQNDENLSEYVEKFKELKEKLGKEYSKVSSTNKIDRSLSIPRIAMGKYKDTAQKTNGGNIRKYRKELEVLQKNKPENNRKRELKFDLNLGEKVYGGIFVKDLEFQYNESKDVLEKHLYKKMVYKNFSIQDGEKILITGNNGSGKTTFLKLLTGKLKPNSGEIKISPNIIIGNYNQEKEFLDNCEMSLIEFLEKNFNDNFDKNVDTKNLLSLQHNVLKKFNFTEEEKNLPVYLFSPGQKNRLLLALFSLKKYNTLFLDEPTNHLDLEAVNELERALQDFNGNLIVVSHDKGFLKNIKFDKEYKIKNGFYLLQ